MRRRSAGVLRGLACASLLAVGPSALAQAAPGGGLTARAYSAVGEAFPTEPAPGSQDQPVAIRPLSSRAEMANPPANAYARAATADLGLAEGYLGQTGSNAEASTSVDDQPREVVKDDSGSHLEARVTEAPSGQSSAEGSLGGPSGSGRSSADVRVADGALVVDIEAEVQDLVFGPLLIGNGRFDAHVRVDGTPGGLEATGRIEMAQASVADIPVVIDSKGVHVDAAEVPAAAVGELTAQVQQQLSQGGYSDIRVVQPKVVTAADGTSAEVSGGGVALYFTNNDPSSLYFISYRLLGGKAAAAVGSAFDVIGPPAAGSGSAPAGPGDPSAAPTTGGTPPATGGAVDGPDATAAAPVYADARTVVALDGIWPGWPWVVAAAAVVMVASSLALRHPRVRRWTTATLDQYVRG